jgi:hypothetical protein
VRDNLVREGKLAEALNGDLLAFKKTELAEKKRLEELYFIELRALKFSEADAERIAAQKAQQDINEELYRLQTAFDEQTKKDLIDSNKFDRDIALRRKDMLLGFERQRLIDQGRLVEAARLEELDKDVLKEELRLQFLQDFLDSGMEAGEAARRAEEEAELESAQRIFDGKKKLSELERQDRITKAEIIAKSIGQINQGLFNNNKSLAVASTIADTYAAAQKAAASAAFPFNIPLVAGAIAQGIGNVKKILATKLGSKNVSKDTVQQPNISTSFGLVDVGTNSPMASQMASQVGAQNNQFQPTFVFTGDLDPEIMAIKVREGSNAISGKSISIGA